MRICSSSLTLACYVGWAVALKELEGTLVKGHRQRRMRVRGTRLLKCKQHHSKLLGEKEASQAGPLLRGGAVLAIDLQILPP